MKRMLIISLVLLSSVVIAANKIELHNKVTDPGLKKVSLTWLNTEPTEKAKHDNIEVQELKFDKNGVATVNVPSGMNCFQVFSEEDPSALGESTPIEGKRKFVITCGIFEGPNKTKQKELRVSPEGGRRTIKSAERLDTKS